MAWFACTRIGAVAEHQHPLVPRGARVLRRALRGRRRGDPARAGRPGRRGPARAGLDRRHRGRPRPRPGPPGRVDRRPVRLAPGRRGRRRPGRPRPVRPGVDPVHVGDHVAAQGGRADPRQRPVERQGERPARDPDGGRRPPGPPAPLPHQRPVLLLPGLDVRRGHGGHPAPVLGLAVLGRGRAQPLHLDLGGPVLRAIAPRAGRPGRPLVPAVGQRLLGWPRGQRSSASAPWPGTG